MKDESELLFTQPHPPLLGSTELSVWHISRWRKAALVFLFGGAIALIAFSQIHFSSVLADPEHVDALQYAECLVSFEIGLALLVYGFIVLFGGRIHITVASSKDFLESSKVK